MVHCAIVAPVARVTLLCGNRRDALFFEIPEAELMAGDGGTDDVADESRRADAVAAPSRWPRVKVLDRESDPSAAGVRASEFL